MGASTITVAFYIVFLVIFFLTAIVALGGIIRTGPFANVSEANTKWLVGALVVQLVGAVILTYRNLPKPVWETTQPFSLSMTYVDYVDDWVKSLKPIDHDCIELYEEGYSPPSCNNVLANYRKVKSVIGDQGGGDLYLETAAGLTREGSALYLFPGESVRIVMNVSGHEETGGNVKLTFKQPKRYVKNSDGTFTERPEHTFRIEFVPDENNKNIYRGTLYHPSITIEGRRMKLADAILIRKAL